MPCRASGVGGQKQGRWEESLLVGRRLACCPVVLPNGLLPWEQPGGPQSPQGAQGPSSIS